MAIICTQDDLIFKEYEEKVSKHEVIFNIKTIFKDHWNNFVNKFTNLFIRDTYI